MGKNKYRELTKNTILFAIGNFGVKIISFLLVPLYTYVLSTSEYGTLDVLNTTISLLIPVLTLNVQDAVLRFTLDKDFDHKEIISSSVQIISLSSIVLFLFVISTKLTGLIRLEWNYLVYLIVIFSLHALQHSFSMYLKARNRVSTIVVTNILETVLTCGLNLIFLLYYKMGISGYLFANMISYVIGVLYCLVFGRIITDISLKYSKNTIIPMIKYSSPLMVNSLAWWMNDASDRYILTYFRGTAINGVYAVAYKIPTILATIQGIFYNAWSVSAIKEFDKNDTDGFVGNVYSLYSCVSFVGCSFLMIINPIIAHVIYSKEFYYAWRYVPALLTASVFNGISLFDGCLYTAVKRTKEVTKTTMIGAGVNTLLNFSLIPLMGAYGASIATCVGYLVVCIVRTFSLRKIIRMKVSWISQVVTTILILGQAVLATFENTLIYQLLLLGIMMVVQRECIVKILYIGMNKINRKE